MGNTCGGLKKVYDNEEYINNLVNVLKQWSNKNTFNIIFDSDFDGDGWTDNVLHDKVFNKSNLYFITFDTNNNVFGGYVSAKINTSNCYVNDENPFIFSLVRDGNVKKKYPMKSFGSNRGLYLWSNRRFGWLYLFGDDIGVKRIGDNESWCKCDDYEYNNEKSPLIDVTIYTTNFEAKRIIVVEMS